MIEKVRRNVANALWATKREREKSLSPLRLFATPWVVAYQAPTSMGFSRQEYWSGLPFPLPGDLPNSGIEPRSPTLRGILYHLSHQRRPYITQMGYNKAQIIKAWHLVKTLTVGKAFTRILGPGMLLYRKNHLN